MLRPVTSKREQQKIYGDLRSSLRSKFSDIKTTDRYTFFSGYKGDASLEDFGISIWSGENWLGFNLDGVPFSGEGPKLWNVLGFATYSEKSKTGRTAAILARDTVSRKIVVLHDGRVFSRDGRGKPSSTTQVRLKNRNYYFVAYLDSPDFFSQVVQYHLHRINPNLAHNSASKNVMDFNGFDPGIGRGGTRGRVTFEAIHSPIAKELKRQVSEFGFEVVKTKTVKPDLLVSNGRIKVLFEVKPEARSHDLMLALVLALGQILTYDKFCKAKKLVVVTKKLANGELAKAVKSLMSKNEIHILEYTAPHKGGVGFPHLKQLLG